MYDPMLDNVIKTISRKLRSCCGTILNIDKTTNGMIEVQIGNGFIIFNLEIYEEAVYANISVFNEILMRDFEYYNSISYEDDADINVNNISLGGINYSSHEAVFFLYNFLISGLDNIIKQLIFSFEINQAFFTRNSLNDYLMFIRTVKLIKKELTESELDHG